MPAPARGRVIAQVGRLVEANKEALARLVTREIGKPYAESLGEVQEIVDTCDFFLGEGRRLYGQTVPSEMPDKQLFTFRMPVGVAAIVTAGNFPVAVPVVVPRAGDPVRQRGRVEAGRVLAPRSATRWPSCSTPAACPAACSTSCRPTGAETFAGPRARRWRRAWSTRSASPARAPSAREIGELCGRHLQSPCLELGGKNPMVVMDDADVDLAVEGALFGGFGTAGQRCTSLGTAIVHESRPRRVRAPSSPSGCARAPIGDPTAGRPVRADDPRALRRALRGLARADPRPPHGPRLDRRAAGSPPTNPREGFVGDPDAGLFYHPTLVVGVRARRRALLDRDVRADRRRRARSRDFDEAMELANGHGYGLSSAIYTTLGRARVPVPRAHHAPAWSPSTTRPRAPRRTCRSAATASPATARASRASGCSTSSPAGSR